MKLNEKLLKLALKRNIKVMEVDLGTDKKCAYYIGKDGKELIIINSRSNEEDKLFLLAHELAHAYLHNDKGDTVYNEKHSEYEEQANRAAEIILDLLAV